MQELKKVAFVGKQCAGKTTAANFLDNPLIVKFAAPLYRTNEALGIGKDRAFMQDMADLVKRHYGLEFFIATFNKTVKDIEENPPSGYEFLVCDDARYPTEVSYLLDNGWFVIYIDAPEEIRRKRAKALGLEFVDNHLSEKLVDKSRRLCYIEIANDGPKAYVREKLKAYIGGRYGY